MQSIETKAGTNYWTADEEKRLWAFLRRLKDRQAERDFVLLKLCRLTGLRRVEALRLNVGDVAGREKIVVDERIAAKGATGEVHIAQELQELLRGFLRLKRQWKEDLGEDAPLFVSRRGTRLSLRSFNDLVDKWCAQAGVSRITPHGLRHTKAQRIMHDTRHLSEDERMRALQFVNRQLRHKSMNSTLIYTAPTREHMEKVGAI
ncbi:tyrosine-type recombinase/integrase [Geoalkalibacter sp.]|uniref:tyrosine-type recombinase/integrase n=1 Tax=Geoalkalibacter sp. TaxID=3041440 RepID=UPI00272DFB07|nr:tyrosine-type recombinase/integrase [Geoalkalibacter sp.]